MPNDQASIILASTSPRRRELVTLFGLTFQFLPVEADESPLPDESPGELVRRLSRAKAERGARSAGRPDAIVVAADTVVSLDGSILAKPQDGDDAGRMLKRLRARWHTVYSGVTVARGERMLTEVATTGVLMRDYADAELEAYVASGDPLDKAAAYAIQHEEFHPVERVGGCFANVMGLPLCHMHRALRAFGVRIDEPDRACQDYLRIVCPVAKRILAKETL